MAYAGSHIHLGPGRLALGLIVPCGLAAGLEVHIVGRPGTEEPNDFVLAFAGRQPSVRRVLSFSGPESFADLQQPALDAVERDAPLLVTATLREDAATRLPLMREILDMRREGAETLFLACENNPDDAYRDLRREFEPRGVVFAETVVNRICPVLRQDRITRRREVRAHPLGEWLIETPSKPMTLMTALRRVEEVQFVRPIKPFEARKRWMVNGAHLMLGIAGQLKPVPLRSLRKAAREPPTALRLGMLEEEIDRVLQHEFPELERNIEYALEHAQAFCEITDRVRRVLPLRRGALEDLFASFDARLSEPARIAAQLRGGRVPAIFMLILDGLDRLFELHRYVDAKALENREFVLTEEGDVRAVERYRAMLNGWVPADDAETRARRLARMLRSDRALQAEPHRRGPTTT